MDRLTRVRAALLLALFFGITLFFAARLYNLQIVQTGGGKVDNTKTFTSFIRVRAARGDILDCNGNVLVSNRTSYDLVLDSNVIMSAAGTNQLLLELVQRCRELDLSYNDHFPVSTDAPFRYTLNDYNATWQGYFQNYLAEVAGGLDSDISAPLLVKKLRTSMKIPETWSDQDARAVIGLRYEIRLRLGNITPLPMYVFMDDVDSISLAAILELNIPGLTTEASTVREYRTDYAAHILGYCSSMTAEQWEYYSHLENQKYEMDAQVGQSGLELAFEEYLHGEDGIRVDVKKADGTLIKQYYLEGNEPKAGKNVEISIDLNLQSSAEDALEKLITTLRQQQAESDKKIDGGDVEGGAVVVMDVRNGKILTCASYPTYNLSTFREDWDELKDAPFAPLYNRALMAVYPPGSTYKMSMVVAGIDSGLITSLTRIRDMGVFDKYAPSFTANCLAWSSSHSTHIGHDGQHGITAAEALSVSCNYFFYDIGDRMALAVMDATAKGLGLGESTGVELAENIGHRANSDTKKKLYSGDESRWYAADQVMASIGQSDNRFSPLQLCVYASTLANQGIRYKATFLNQVVSSDYTRLEYVNQPQILSTLNISDEAYAAVIDGMKMVAQEGTARRVLENYPIPVAAKTGTAQHSNVSMFSDNGAFVCFAPADNPQIAIAVYGEKAGHGSTLAQIGKAVLDTYFNNPEVGDVTTTENELS